LQLEKNYARINFLLTKKNMASSSTAVPQERSRRYEVTYVDCYGFEYYGDNGDRAKIWHESFAATEKVRETKLRRFISKRGLFDDLDKDYSRNRHKLEGFCRRGLFYKDPMERGRIWAYSLGALHLQKRHPTTFATACATPIEEKIEKDIEVDLQRSIVNHPSFRDGPDSLVPSLRKILHALSVQLPTVGYVQGMNITCGLLLIFMPEELAFWSMMTILQGSYLTRHQCDLGLENYYTPQMELLFCDLKILREMLVSRKESKPVILWLEQNDVHVEELFVKWLLTFTAGALPVSTVARIWDSFFHEGIKVLFRIIVVVLESNKKELLEARGLEDVMALWRKIVEDLYDHEYLMYHALKVRGNLFTRRTMHNETRRDLAAQGEEFRNYEIIQTGNKDTTKENGSANGSSLQRCCIVDKPDRSKNEKK